MKLSRHFKKISQLLEETGLYENARYVERATLGHQRVLKLSEVDPDTVPYFSMILAHRRGAAWR